MYTAAHKYHTARTAHSRNERRARAPSFPLVKPSIRPFLVVAAVAVRNLGWVRKKCDLYTVTVYFYDSFLLVRPLTDTV